MTDVNPTAIATLVAMVVPARAVDRPPMAPIPTPAVAPVAAAVIADEALATDPAAFEAAFTAIVCITCKLGVEDEQQ